MGRKVAYFLIKKDAKNSGKSDNVQIVKGPHLPGPVHDLRWEGVTFVVGTMGDDYETRTLERLANSLRLAWTDGSDTTACHPGDRALLVEYAVIADSEVTDELMSRRHLVALGSPRTNMLLARFRGRIGVDWSLRERAARRDRSFSCWGEDLSRFPRRPFFFSARILMLPPAISWF